MLNMTGRYLVLMTTDALRVLPPSTAPWRTAADPAQTTAYAPIDGLPQMATFSGKPQITGFSAGSGDVIVEEGVAATALAQGLSREGRVLSPLGPLTSKNYPSQDALLADLSIAANVLGVTAAQLASDIAGSINPNGGQPILSGYLTLRDWTQLVAPPGPDEALYEMLQKHAPTPGKNWEDLTPAEQQEYTSTWQDLAGKYSIKTT